MASTSPPPPPAIPSFKIALIGAANVGKTSMITRFTTGQFTSLVNTVQASCVKKVLETSRQKVQLEIWDTAGQERYRSVGPLFFRNALACIAVYDVSDPASLTAIDGYVHDYKDCFEAENILVIAANKMDLVDGDDALRPGQEYADAHQYGLFATSAKSGVGIEELFRHVADSLAGVGACRTQPEPEVAPPTDSGGCC
jgi:small GTP-binding protein